MSKNNRKKLIAKYPLRFAAQYGSCMCIYKLSFNDHFFISSTTQLIKRAYVISADLERRLRLGIKPNDIYANVVACIKEHDVKEMIIEVLFTVDKVGELPAALQRMYNIVRDNPKCLNTTFEASAPIDVAAAVNPDEKISGKIVGTFAEEPAKPWLQSVAGIEVEAPRKEVVPPKHFVPVVQPNVNEYGMIAAVDPHKGVDQTTAAVVIIDPISEPGNVVAHYKHRPEKMNSFQEALKKITQEYGATYNPEIGDQGNNTLEEK
jgi:hypothetical protein